MPRAKKIPLAEKPYTVTGDAIIHLSEHISRRDEGYLDDRYWSGFETGLAQVALTTKKESTDIVAIINTDRKEVKAGKWQTDPLENGKINGRKVGLMMLMQYESELVFGTWSDPAV